MKTFCIKSRLMALVCAAALGLWGAPQTFAADDPEPAITVKTAAFEVADVYNFFTFCIDVDETIYIDVDCGFGPVEYEIEPSQDGTWFPCTVTSEGTVRIFTDKPEAINYLYCQGGHITEIDLSKLTALQILDLSRNKLKKIDLSNNTKLQYLDLGANPFGEEPLIIGKLPLLTVLEIESVGNISPDFDLANYPQLKSFAAFSSKSLTHLDPSGCPGLERISVDVTGLTSLDVSKNPELRILNISDTFITSIDVSKNTGLEQLYVGHGGSYASNYKLSSLDVSNNPKLAYLFAQNNNIRTIDISNNPLLSDLQLEDNLLEAFDCSENLKLNRLNISNNYLDFATLPLGRVFSEYYYSQRPMPVALSFPVGAQLDLSKRVLREGTETEMHLYGVSNGDIRNPVLLSKDYYEYDEGIIMFKKEYPDSVYASFVNLDFPECVLTTTKFMVKAPDQYGKPVSVLNFSPTVTPGMDLEFGLGVEGASVESPRTVFVDFGDGVNVPVSVTCQVPESPNVKGKRVGYGAVKVLVNDGDNITGLSIDGCRLYGIDLAKSPTLRSLSLTGTHLSYIDLTWQRCLETLILKGNNFGTLNVTTDVIGYKKNVLHTVDLSDNGLYELYMESQRCLKHINVSHNHLTEVPIYDAYNLLTLDVSYNDFTSLEIEHLDSLQTLNVAGNNLTFIWMPGKQTLRNLDCRYNPFTFANLPCRPGELEGEYLYAPQNNVDIVGRGPSCSLPDIGFEVDGIPTEFVWHKVDGSVLKEGSDYVVNNGTVIFSDYSLGKVYCTMTNKVYPDLTLLTSEMLVVAPPTKVLGWMDVADDPSISDNKDMSLIMGAVRDGESVYIDWNGDGQALSEYKVGTTYEFFHPDPVPGRRAVIYAYDDGETGGLLDIFSLNNVPLKGGDFSELKSIKLFDINYVGCKDIVLPDTETLHTLGLNGNGITSIDLSKYRNLKKFSAADNNFESFDLSVFPSLQTVNFIGNRMKEIKFDNPNLWELNLEGNEFEHLSFEGLPSLRQASLNKNRLKTIDINASKSLQVLYIEENQLDFQTLPVVPETVTVYRCANQARVPAFVKGLTVDLSSQAERDGVPTVFNWCVDEPYYDVVEGVIYGEFLESGVDYTINDGVSTFYKDVANVCCVMVNELFPRMFLLTDLMTLTSAGVEAAVVAEAAISVDGHTLTIFAEEGTQYGVYSTDGIAVATGSMTDRSVDIELPIVGIYVVKAGNASMKVVLK